MTISMAKANGLQVVELDECVICTQVAPVNPDGICGACLDLSRKLTDQYACHLNLTPADAEYFSVHGWQFDN